MKIVEKSYTMIKKENVKTISWKCDFCNREMQGMLSSQLQKEVADNFDFKCEYVTVTVKFEADIVYGGECGDKLEIELDVCPTCFKKQIMDKAINHSIKKSEW